LTVIETDNSRKPMKMATARAVAAVTASAQRVRTATETAELSEAKSIDATACRKTAVVMVL